MKFFQKTKTNKILNVRNLKDLQPEVKKKRRKIITLSIVFGLIIILLGLGGYLVSKGSKIFDKNSTGGSSLLQKLTGASDLKTEGDGRINILIMGRGGASHLGGMLTDSIMVVSLNPSDKSVAMLSIPRDLYVKIPDHKVSTKINKAYSIGENEKKGTGAALAKKTVGDVLDIPIHYYITLDFAGFVKVINVLGGIDVTVERAIYDPSYPDENMQGYSPFTIKAGQQHLDGKTALKYARSRESTSDFDRAARQQKVMGAVREKASSLGFLANPKKILDMVSALSDNLRTDFTVNEMKALISLAKDVSSDKIINKVLSNAPDSGLYEDSSTGTYYLKPKGGNFDEIRRIAHEIFIDPSITDEKATISVVNSSGGSGLAAKLGTDLKSYGYSVTNVSQGKTIVDTTVINDYNNDKNKATIQFLKTRLGVAVVQKQTGNTTGAQIEIIIGKDYKGFSKAEN